MPGRFLFLEPHFSGSHKAFAEGLKAHSRHEIELLTLPGMHWKWRMRGAALHFAGALPDLSGFDGLLVSNMVDLACLKGLVPSLPPALVYMHESQLTYPPPQGEKLNVDLAMQEIATALAAEVVVFNSRHHRDQFIESLGPFFARFPDHRPSGLEAVLGEKSRVIHPGCSLPSALPEMAQKQMAPPLVVWNHRWSYDKNFPAMLHALEILAGQGARFQLALLGESAGGKAAEPFERARAALKERIAHFGYCATAEVYRAWLSRGAIVVSSAIQENFGISVVEAMAHGCLPLLPRRLAYPEILPGRFHDAHLYTSQRDCIAKLGALLTGCHLMADDALDLARRMGEHDWQYRITAYDNLLTHFLD